MTQLNSYISNSDSAKPRSLGLSMQVTAWVLVGLIVIDLLIDFLLAYPSDTKVTAPPRLQAYFEYGRSIEGQLSRMTRADRSQTALITLAGWYDPLQIEE